MFSSTESSAEVEYKAKHNLCSHTYCKPLSRIRWTKNKGAVLIVLWSFLVTHVYYLLEGGIKVEKNSEHPLGVSVAGLIMLSTTLLFPVGGWLADSRVGRYKMVHYSTWMMWTCTIFITLGEVLAYVSTFYSIHVNVWVFRGLCIVLTAGLAGFQSNIVQLGIDQLIDASSDEITSFIFWYVFLVNASGISLSFVTDCVAVEYQMYYIKVLFVAVCLTIVICSDFVLNTWLVDEHVTKKSLREICKIIWYIIKHRNLHYNFINSIEDELPSAKRILVVMSS